MPAVHYEGTVSVSRILVAPDVSTQAPQQFSRSRVHDAQFPDVGEPELVAQLLVSSLDLQ